MLMIILKLKKFLIYKASCDKAEFIIQFKISNNQKVNFDCFIYYI